jgi:hypothetical protein
LISQEDIEAFELPQWAAHKANGDYTMPNASLPTKDGRVAGNAVMIGLSDKQWEGLPVVYKVITDAGNIMRMTEQEMKSVFHPPEYCMIELMPAHYEALRNEGEKR